MVEWRLLRGWTEAELAERLAGAHQLRRSFEAEEDETTPERGWNRYGSDAVVAVEPAGAPAPGGAFERAWQLVEGYAFSHPRIVRGHFIGGRALLGRHMLLELRILGLRLLGAVVVAAVRADDGAQLTVRGFRYDTLDGHFERGWEWFVVTKDHASGEVRFRIHAAWRRGDLPNAVFRLGFRLLARSYQRAWHRLAHLRLRRLLGTARREPLGPVIIAGHLAPVSRPARPRRLLPALLAAGAIAYALSRRR